MPMGIKNQPDPCSFVRTIGERTKTAKGKVGRRLLQHNNQHFGFNRCPE